MTNSGSKVTEFYLYSADGMRIVGEVENIGPGLQGKLIVTADRGHVPHVCKPGMLGDGHPRRLHGHEARGRVAQRRRDDQVLVSRAQNDYRRWVQGRPTASWRAPHCSWTATSRATTPAPGRATRTPACHWEAIETVAESFGDLDPETDAREADLEPGPEVDRLAPDREGPLAPAREGLHAADPGPAEGLRRRPARQHVTRRDRDPAASTFTTDQIANGSSGLMEEVATGKVTGEEEYWSHTDLWDFAANVEGARVAFEGVKPILRAA